MGGELRPAVLAGQWYPAHPATLTEQLEGCLAKTRRLAGVEAVRGLIVPHAGLMYSGGTAAWAYRQVLGAIYDTVALVALCHGRGRRFSEVVRFGGAALFAGAGYDSPLGVVPCDRALAQQLVALRPDLFAYHDEAHRYEHSVEMQLPFLRLALPGAVMVPVLIQTTRGDVIDGVAAALAATTAGRRVLFIASTDLSHRPRYDDAARCDRRMLEALAAGDAAAVRARAAEIESERIPDLQCALCSLGAVLVLLHTLALQGPTRGVVLHYANSGDVTGEHDQVVGYGAVAYCDAA